MTRVHLIGIGGIGMSALAHLALDRGWQVTGSDRQPSEITFELEARGVLIDLEQTGRFIEPDVLCVYSSAVKSKNAEWVKGQALQCRLMHRSEFLKQMMEGKIPIMVTGAHGKTTTTALLVAVFRQAGLNPSYAIGGRIPQDRHARFQSGPHFIYEADESDGSFLLGQPDGAIFINIDQEHLDYWKSLDRLIAGFLQGMQNVGNRSRLILNFADPYLVKLAEQIGVRAACDLQASDISVSLEGTSFNLIEYGRSDQAMTIKLVGEHYVQNALLVIRLARAYGIEDEFIQQGFKKFQGVSRRFEMIGSIHETWIVDDYAHHPTEIDAVLKSLERMEDQLSICVIFQPHRYFRLEALFDEFVAVFHRKIDLVLLPIYAASEGVIEGLEDRFASQLRPRRLVRCLKDEAMNFLEREIENYDVVITMGAGDVTHLGRAFLKDRSQRAACPHHGMESNQKKGKGFLPA